MEELLRIIKANFALKPGPDLIADPIEDGATKPIAIFCAYSILLGFKDAQIGKFLGVDRITVSTHITTFNRYYKDCEGNRFWIKTELIKNGLKLNNLIPNQTKKVK